jgi:hypothetical protein
MTTAINQPVFRAAALLLGWLLAAQPADVRGDLFFAIPTYVFSTPVAASRAAMTANDQPCRRCYGCGWVTAASGR